MPSVPLYYVESTPNLINLLVTLCEGHPRTKLSDLKDIHHFISVDILVIFNTAVENNIK